MILSYTKKNTERRKWNLSLNYEELKQKNAPQKATTNDMIAKMEQATQVTIVESDYWKALINLNRNQNQQLSTIEQNQVDEETISHYSAQIILQVEKENDRTGRYNSETTEESENDTDRTGWEYEREYAFGYRTDEEFTERSEEEMDSDILWNNNRHSSVLSDTLYFAGDLFKMIDNQTRYHRKKIKLSQKEIEKRLAHGQKSDGYEEYEDYYNNNQLSM